MRTVVAALLAALVVTIWSAVSWVVLPWHVMTMSTIPDGEAVVSALSERIAPSNPWTYVRGFLLNFVAAFVAAALLARAAPSLPRFGHRVLFVALVGGFAAVQTRLLDWNWWAFPLDYSLAMAVDLVVAWALAGLVLAWRIRPPTSVVEGVS